MTSDIEYEARRFWRDQEFWGICCDDEDCIIDVYRDGDQIIIDMDDHDYTVSILRATKFTNPQNIKPYELNLIEGPGALSITKKEIDFWDKVAELYQELPEWIVEERAPVCCCCSTQTLMASGCICGGI